MKRRNTAKMSTAQADVGLLSDKGSALAYVTGETRLKSPCTEPTRRSPILGNPEAGCFHTFSRSFRCFLTALFIVIIASIKHFAFSLSSLHVFLQLYTVFIVRKSFFSFSLFSISPYFKTSCFKTCCTFSIMTLPYWFQFF